MITFLLNAVKIIFLLGLLIGIHETGHFLIAKLCKVKVNEFAIGFGPTIWKKQGKETKYAIRLIPLGGFVNMEGEEEHSDKEGSFSNASIPKRIAIVIAGAMVNIIFAIIIYFILLSIDGNNTTTIVDTPIPEYAAISAGIQQNDEIIKINGKRTRTLEDVTAAMNKCNGDEITVTIKRNGKTQDISFKPTEEKYKETGIYLYQVEQKSTKIAALVPKSPAEQQGLKAGDNIISVNDIYVKDNPEELINFLNKNDYTLLKFDIERNGKQMTIDVTPSDKSVYYLGVAFKPAENNFLNNTYYAGIGTGKFLVSILDNVKQLFIGEVKVDQMMGPVGISELVAKTNGVREFVYMLALISISLGVTNLMPFPPLDGGKILFLIIEAIRRKPLKETTEMKIQIAGFAFLIGLSIFITYKDILRIF